MPVFKFAVVADNEVFTLIMLDTDDDRFPQSDRLVAGFQSSPQIVEVTDYDGVVNVGDEWDGTKFTAGQG